MCMLFLGQIQAKIYLLPGKRSPKIMIDGYIYCINRRTPERTFWLCNSYSKTKCTARVTTVGSKTAKLSNKHNHPPSRDTEVTDQTQFTLATIIQKKTC